MPETGVLCALRFSLLPPRDRHLLSPFTEWGFKELVSVGAALQDAVIKAPGTLPQSWQWNPRLNVVIKPVCILNEEMLAGLPRMTSRSLVAVPNTNELETTT